MSNISRGIGTQLAQGATNIGSITKIGGVTLKRDFMDKTILATATGYKVSLPGITDAGTVAIEGYCDSGDAGQAALLAAYATQYTAQTPSAYTITYPTVVGASWTFNAFIETIEMSGDADEKNSIPFKVTLKVDDQPSFATTATANLTGITASSGTLCPTFAGSAYNYALEISGTAETFTPIGISGQTYDFYVDSVLQGTYTQGSVSPSVALAVIGNTHVISIIVRQSGYSSKTYTIIAVKTS